MSNVSDSFVEVEKLFYPFLFYRDELNKTIMLLMGNILSHGKENVSAGIRAMKSTQSRDIVYKTTMSKLAASGRGMTEAQVRELNPKAIFVRSKA
jgi:hypothetical protein